MSPLNLLAILAIPIVSVSAAGYPLTRITNASPYLMHITPQLGTRPNEAAPPPDKCAVWNWRAGNTIWQEPEANCAQTELAPDTESKGEGFTFNNSGYQTQFEISDWKGWRDIHQGAWTRVRLDQTVKCTDGDHEEAGEGGKKGVPRCVISARKQEKKPVVESATRTVIEGGENKEEVKGDGQGRDEL